jgi:hypothetical protein
VFSNDSEIFHMVNTTNKVPRSLAVLLLPRRVSALIVYATGVVKAMTGNPAFPSPMPLLALASAAIADLQDAEVMAVDMVYSRAFWVAPGLQRAIHGAGDIEGVAVFYRRGADGLLSVDHAVVDDGTEHLRELSRGDVLALDPVRPTFYSDVWSHQLGGRGARSRDDLVDVQCYVGDGIRPLPEDLARSFRVDEDRAPPAHVEQLAGRRVDAPRANREVARADGLRRR